jgi:hypothetical protein
MDKRKKGVDLLQREHQTSFFAPDTEVGKKIRSAQE